MANLIKKAVDSVKNSYAAPGGLLGPGGLIYFGNRSNLGGTVDSSKSGFGPNQVPNGVTNYFSGQNQLAMGPSSVKSDVNTNDPNAATGLQSTVGGLGTGTSSAYEPQYVQLPNGQVFDISDPAQRIAFFNAKNAFLDQQQSEQYNLFSQGTQQALQDAERQYGSLGEGINYDLQNLQQQLQDYNLGAERNVQDTNQAYDIGTVRRQNAFAQASPLAYQSSQGTSQQFALGQRDQALGDISRDVETTRGNATRQEALLNQQRGDLATNYNQFIQQSQQGLDQYRKSLQDAYNAERSNLSGNLAGIDASQGINQFRYNRQSAGPLSTVNTDLSQYSPYLNFDSLQSSPSYNFFSGFKPQVSNTLKPVDQYLGYDPNSKQKDPVNSYLRG